MPAKSNTTKYLLIAGALAVGYYLYKNGGLGGASDPAQSAFILSWAQGLSGQDAVNFQNAFPSLSAADKGTLANLISAWETGTPSDAQIAFWLNFKQRIGLS